MKADFSNKENLIAEIKLPVKTMKADFSNKENLIAEIKLPDMANYWGGHCEIFAKVPKYKKWYQFWKNNYEELPLPIRKLKTN